MSEEQAIQENGAAESKQIKRHTKLSIFMHWFNAACWLFLLATGIGLIRNADLQPVGGWWTDMMRNIFGGGANLLLAHEIVGILWASVFLIYTIAKIKEVIPFLKEMATVDLQRDVLWLVNKGIQMTLGYKALYKLDDILKGRFGYKPEIPDQGFYNVGQKMFAIPSILGGVVIVVTGVIMTVSNMVLADPVPVQWAILLHFLTVGFVFAGLLIHVYMASIAAGERPAFISMFTGKVPEDYAMHHHRLWYDEVREGR
jgi:formate dehydrogenase subunit gamma